MVKQWEAEGVHITEVSIDSEQAAARLKKPVGKYITLESAGVKQRDPNSRIAMSNLLAEELGAFAAGRSAGDGGGPGQPPRHARCARPLAVDKTLVDAAPVSGNSRRGERAHVPGLRGCARRAGVTGLETMETIKGLVDTVRPARADRCG